MTKVGSRGGIGSPSTIGDDAAAKALEELEKIKAEMLARKAKGGTDSATTPEVGGARPPADRAGAMAVLEPRAVGEPPVDELDQQITGKLRDLGYLPKEPAKVTKDQVDAATRKFLENVENEPITGDIELLLGLLEAKMQKQNARNNGGAGGMQGSRPEGQRPGGLPPAPPPGQQSRGGAPAANAASLQNQAANNIANTRPPPEPGSASARIAESTQRHMGMNTSAGPDGGNLACAWSVNKILAESKPPVRPLGTNPNYVPSVEDALKGGRGVKIDADKAGPGDIVIFPNGHHIGIATGNGQVANNSSSRASFSNLQALPPGCRVYRLNKDHPDNQ